MDQSGLEISRVIRHAMREALCIMKLTPETQTKSARIQVFALKPAFISLHKATSFRKSMPMYSDAVAKPKGKRGRGRSSGVSGGMGFLDRFEEGVALS